MNGRHGQLANGKQREEWGRGTSGTSVNSKGLAWGSLNVSFGHKLLTSGVDTLPSSARVTLARLARPLRESGTDCDLHAPGGGAARREGRARGPPGPGLRRARFRRPSSFDRLAVFSSTNGRAGKARRYEVARAARLAGADTYVLWCYILCRETEHDTSWFVATHFCQKYPKVPLPRDKEVHLMGYRH